MPTAQTQTRPLTSASSAADDYRVTAPPLDVLARAWPVIEPMLYRATSRGFTGYEPIDVLRLTFAGRMGMWLVVDYAETIVAVAVTELKEYPRCRVLELVFLAGNGLKHWHKRFFAALEEHARITGCRDIVGLGRKGWARYGNKIECMVMSRPIPPAIGEVNGHA